MVVSLALLSSALGAPFNTSGYNGAPGSLAGFDSAGNPIDADPGPIVRGVLDEEFPDRASDDRESAAFHEDVEAICLYIVETEAPAIVAAELATLVPTYAPFVEDVCDAQIASVVPDLIDDAIAASVAAEPVFRFGATTDATRRVAWNSVGGGSMGSTGIIHTHVHLVPFVEESAGGTYSGVSTFVQSAVSGTHTVAYTLLDVQAGEPDTILWTSNGIPTSSVGEKLADFSAGGTVTAAGAAWFDANGDLVLAHKDAVVVAVHVSAITSLRTFAPASQRVIGWPMPTSPGLAPIGSWRVPVGSFSSPLASSALEAMSTGLAPAVWLDPS